MITEIHDLYRAIFDGTLANRVNECMAIMRNVISEDDMGRLEFEHLPQSEVTSENLTIDEERVNGLPWSMLTSDDDEVEKMWKTVSTRRAVFHLSNMVEDDNRLVVSDAVREDPFFPEFEKRAAERKELLAALRAELDVLIAETEGFDI